MLRSVWQQIAFGAAFLCSLVLLLALAMEGAGVISGERELIDGKLLFRSLQANILGVGAFLLLSGFLPAYLALYLLFMRKSPQLRRASLSVVIFAASFAFLAAFIGESSGSYDRWLLVLGIACVLASDAIGELVRRAMAR